jgi:general secretion pathway protein M
MTADTLRHTFARYRLATAAVYALLIAACAAGIWLSVTDVLARRAALAASADLLERLEARRVNQGAANLPGGAVPAGSPFLTGDTITVAGAGLLQRVADAITRYGGTVQSSQVDLKGPQAKDDFVTLVISCEMEQPALQKLLYELEAGMPFLFVDQLLVQGPQTTGVARNSKLRILLAVSGRWRGKP